MRRSREYPAARLDVRALAAEADRLGTTVLDLPGDHIGMVTHPAEFARELTDALDR
jgi:hypothetical protein